MANHCSTTVVITGDKEVLEKLETLFSGYKNFTNMSEFGDSFFGGVTTERTPEGTSFTDYGTRWWDFDVSLSDGELVIFGDSAWSPPSHLLRKISEHYPVEVYLEYEESGSDFAGTTTFKGGVAEDNCMRFMEYKYLNDRESFAYELEYMFPHIDSVEEWNTYLAGLTEGWQEGHTFDVSPLMVDWTTLPSKEEMIQRIREVSYNNK